MLAGIPEIQVICGEIEGMLKRKYPKKWLFRLNGCCGCVYV